MSSALIRELYFAPFDVALNEPFGIATGAQAMAQNVLVQITLQDGTRGIGEAAPFPAVNGESQALVLSRLPAARDALLGLSVERYRGVAAAAQEALIGAPSALCAVETALLDALCRRAGLSMWSFFGGAERELRTDITIPTGGVDQAERAARKAASAGFDTLKVKVGGVEPTLDLERLRAIALGAPGAALLLDANASLSAEQAIFMLEGLGSARNRVVLFEQPTPADDLDALRRVRERSGVAVAADESARSSADVARIFAQSAADVINIKIMKSGLIQAWEMITCARALGLRLMIGGMVETELCMTTSACLSAGIGNFEFVDLDTPLFMAARPFLQGGFEQDGPRLRIDPSLPGHGVSFLGAL